MKTVKSFIDYEKLKNNKAVIFYFSHDECNVCKVLLPKIKNLIHSDFPNIYLGYCDVKKYPDVASQNRIFTVPSILIFFEGKQYFQFTRNVSILEIAESIKRPYNMIFN